MLDMCIVQVASCLQRHGTVNPMDGEKVCRLGFEAVQHYARIPIAYYTFALPYFETVIQTKRISPTEALISAYKGVEGLLLEIYEELGEGQVIRDQTVADKVRLMWR